jgi:hypothetical protein
MNRQNFKANANYVMSSPEERREIINRIDNKSFDTNVSTGITKEWWRIQHHPDKDIPKNIYLMGGGCNLRTLHKRYNDKYVTKQNVTKQINWNTFINFTRELIMQGIMRENLP